MGAACVVNEREPSLPYPLSTSLSILLLTLLGRLPDVVPHSTTDCADASAVAQPMVIASGVEP